MNISKFKDFLASGRWATARPFPTAKPEDSIRRPLSTRFAKADALHATSPRISWEERRDLLAFRPWAASPQSAAAPGWQIYWASIFLDFWPGGFGARSTCSSFLALKRRCELLSIGRWIYVLRRISHA